MTKEFKLTFIFSIEIILLIFFSTNVHSDPFRASVTSNGYEAFGRSTGASISRNGRFIAFTSLANNLDRIRPDEDKDSGWPDDDVFVNDLGTRTTTRISVSTGGMEGDHDSWEPSISSDGRYVAFTSNASNFSISDSNYWDVFRHDRETGSTALVSISSTGARPNEKSLNPSISANGINVAFASRATNLVDRGTNGNMHIFVCKIAEGGSGNILVSTSSTNVQGNNNSWEPAISANGNYVAFESWATNLVDGDDTNNRPDIFLHHIATGTTIRVSQNNIGEVGNDESTGACISANGNYVAFQSEASNLVINDTNGVSDVFVYNRSSANIQRVSLASDGSQGNLYSYGPSISANGRYVAFYSYATNLVEGDTNDHGDVFLHDRATGETTRLSLGQGGIQGNSTSLSPAISANARSVAFESVASNLVPGDAMGHKDVFVVSSGVIFFTPAIPSLLISK
jgi:Tol biopolymer transport system component